MGETVSLAMMVGLLATIFFICMVWLTIKLRDARNELKKLKAKYRQLKYESLESASMESENISKITRVALAEIENKRNDRKYPISMREKYIDFSWEGNCDRITEEQPIQHTPHNHPPVQTVASEDAIDFVSHQYNQVKNWNDESAFTENYRCIWFDCQNSMARIQHVDTKPIFATDQDGSYMAVAILESSDIYYVFPRFSKAYNEAAHNPGGMKEVFDSNFMPGESYDTIIVTKPAQCSLDGRIWTLKERGELELKF